MMMTIDIRRFCVILLSLWTLCKQVRGQDYYYDTEGEATTAAEEGSGTTTTDAGTTTVTEFPDYPDTTASEATAPAVTSSGGGGGNNAGGGAGGGGGGGGGGTSTGSGSSDIIPAEILQLIPFILTLILPLIQQSQTPAPPPQIVFITPAPVLTAPPPVTQPPLPEPEHHYHHHAPYHPIIDPFALHPLSFYDYALFGAPLLPFRTNDQTLQRLKKPSDRKTSRMMKVKKKKKVKSYSRISKQKMNPLAPRPLRRVSPLKTRRKYNKKLIKKRTYPVRKRQIGQKKSQKKIQFRRQFKLPGRSSSPVLVSSSDLVRGVNFAFKGKSYRLTLHQMMKLLRRKNLLKKRKIRPKSKLRNQKYFGRKVLQKSSGQQVNRVKKKP